MYITEEIYFSFRKAQAESNNRGFRMPKDFAGHLKTRMSEKNVEALELATGYFNTKWQNVNLFRYMQCGFNLYKNFTYTQFFNTKVMDLYKVRDKLLKRETRISKEEIMKSVKFVKRHLGKRSLREYMEVEPEGNIRAPVRHYLKGHIDKFFFVWLIKERMLMLNDDERALVPYVVEHYRDIVDKLDGMNNFMSKLREALK